MPRDSNLPLRDWLLGHGPAMPRRQLWRLCACLSLPPVLTTLTFALRGYWYVLLFVLAQQALLAGVVVHQLRRRIDYDRIVLTGDALLVEQGRGRQRFQLRLDLSRTRMSVDANDDALLHFRCDGGDIALGSYATLARRRQVARELSCCLPPNCIGPDTG